MVLFLVSITLLAGCESNRAKTSENIISDTLFSDFLNDIPAQELPMKLECSLPDGSPFRVAFEKHSRYVPKSIDRVYGKINTANENYSLIVYGITGDDIYPVLFSYDRHGKITDSLSLILSGCGAADETQIPISSVSIDKNLTITRVDSTLFIHYLKTSTNEFVVDSVRTERSIVNVDKMGRFTMSNYIDPTGTYILDESKPDDNGEVYGYFGEIHVTKLSQTRIMMDFSICKGAPSYNLGNFIDTLAYHDNKAIYKGNGDDDPSCLITFNFSSKGIDVKEKTDSPTFGCGFGHDVDANGFFINTSFKK